jgi:hypothetical protein
MRFLVGLFIFCCPPLWPFWLIYDHYRGKRRRKRALAETTAFYPKPTFDSSHFKSDAEMAHALDKGEILAGFSTQSGKPIYYTPEPGQRRAVIAYGNMGSGKTSSVIIPFLLTWGLE